MVGIGILVFVFKIFLKKIYFMVRILFFLFLLNFVLFFVNKLIKEEDNRCDMMWYKVELVLLKLLYSRLVFVIEDLVLVRLLLNINVIV